MDTTNAFRYMNSNTLSYGHNGFVQMYSMAFLVLQESNTTAQGRKTIVYPKRKRGVKIYRRRTGFECRILQNIESFNPSPTWNCMYSILLFPSDDEELSGYSFFFFFNELQILRQINLPSVQETLPSFLLNHCFFVKRIWNNSKSGIKHTFVLYFERNIN